MKLYVYDLSNGLARQMSMSLTGRQIGTNKKRIVTLPTSKFFKNNVVTNRDA